MSDDSGILYCANHPHSATGLRCNRCEKPICAKCAVLTPIGYRCKECVRGQLKVYDTAKGIDYPLLFGAVVTLAAIGGLAHGPGPLRWPVPPRSCLGSRQAPPEGAGAPTHPRPSR